MGIIVWVNDKPGPIASSYEVRAAAPIDDAQGDVRILHINGSPGVVGMSERASPVKSLGHLIASSKRFSNCLLSPYELQLP